MYCELSGGDGGDDSAITRHQKTTRFAQNAESKIDKKEASNTTQFFTTNRGKQHNSYSKQSTLFQYVYTCTDMYNHIYMCEKKSMRFVTAGSEESEEDPHGFFKGLDFLLGWA